MIHTQTARSVSLVLKRRQAIEKAANGASEEELRIAKPFYDKLQEVAEKAK